MLKKTQQVKTDVTILNILFRLCVFFLTLGQFSAIYKNGESSVYIFDIFILVFSIFGIFYFLSIKKLYIPIYVLFLIGFSFIGFISLLLYFYNLEISSKLISFLYLLRFLSYLGGSLVIYNMLKNKIINTDEIYKTFLCSGSTLAVLGLFQLILFPDFEKLDPLLGWDPHKNRLASTFFDPNFLGAYFVMCITLIFDKFYYFKQNFVKSDYVHFIIILLALFMTFSRSAWGMLALTIMIFGIFKSKKMLVVFVIVAFSAYFAIPRVQTRLSGTTDPSDSAKLRIQSWQNTAKVIRDYYVTGVGFNSYRYVQKEYGFLNQDTFNIHSGAGSDSSILFIIATTGVFGVVLYIMGLFSPLFCNKLIKFTNLFYLSTILSLIIESFFINSLFFPNTMFMLFSFSALQTFRNAQ